MHTDTRRRSSPPLLAALALLALGAGCATARTGERVVWPPPPDTARIQYVRTIAKATDFESAGRRFWGAITGKKPATVTNPTALALGPGDRMLYVSLAPLGIVLALDLQEGSMGRMADEEGARPSRPYGLAVDGEGNLYVGDQLERLVWVYSPTGRFLRQIGKGTFTRPTGLAFDRQRSLLYVVDGSNGVSENHRVEVFAPDGRHLRTIGKRGDGPGEFNFPSFIAVGPEGKVYVADTGNFRIEVFDAQGAFLTSFGEVGEAPGQFGKTKGMAFDSFGNLYVVDGQVGIVQMFNAEFQPLMAFGGVLNREEFFQSPNDIVIDSKNNIYVSDFGANRVNQYVLVNTTAADARGAAAPAPAPGARPSPAIPPAR